MKVMNIWDARIAILFALLVPGGIVRAADESATDTLSTFPTQIRAVQSLHFKATVTRKIDEDASSGETNKAGKTPGFTKTIVGEYDYYIVADGRFLVKSKIDPKMQVGADAEFAYDGKRYQFLDRSSKQLVLSKKASFSAGGALMINPLAYAMFYAIPDYERPTFIELHAITEKSALKEKLSKASIIEQAANGGGSTFGIPTEDGILQIVMAKEHAYLPKKIAGASPDGSGVRIDIGDYVQKDSQKAGHTYWPMTLSFELTDHKVVTERTDIKLTMLEVDAEVPDSTFVIDYRSAKTIIDEDAKGSINVNGPARLPATKIEIGGPASQP